MPHSRQRPSVLRTTLAHYLAQSQVHGYRIIVAADRPYVERFMWSCISLASIAFTVWLITYAYFNVMVAATVSSERPNRVSVLDLPFPAVAFCSENRISRQALLEYAQFILSATANSTDHIGRNVDEVAAKLLILGKIYDLRMDEDDFYQFDRVHSVLLNAYGGDDYPIQNILEQLVPKCDAMLKRCKWLGRSANCSSLFNVRRTYTGICCTFNYVRPVVTDLQRQIAANGTIRMADAARVNKHGDQFGLVVLLDQVLQDYAFALHSNQGVRIMVFDPENFPDQTSGAVKERFLGVGEEMFLTVAPQPNNGSAEMRKLDRRRRNCVFDDEIALIYEKFYTLSECLLVCRLESLRQFCGCTLPQYTRFEPNVPHCLLADMPCLGRWSSKWYNSESLINIDGDGNNVVRPTTDELDPSCPNCLPLCNMVRYDVQSSTSNFGRHSFDGRLLDPEFTRGLEADNHSIVYVNFGRHKVPAFDQDRFWTWYEELAYFGGLASLAFGASILSVVEIVYFATGNFGALLFAAHRPQSDISDA